MTLKCAPIIHCGKMVGGDVIIGLAVRHLELMQN